MPKLSDSALLILDFQVGIGDQPYAKNAAQGAAAALSAGRMAGLPVAFSKVKLFNLSAAGGVVHFDAVALGPNLTSFAENFEVPRESRQPDVGKRVLKLP